MTPIESAEDIGYGEPLRKALLDFVQSADQNGGACWDQDQKRWVLAHASRWPELFFLYAWACKVLKRPLKVRKA